MKSLALRYRSIHIARTLFRFFRARVRHLAVLAMVGLALMSLGVWRANVVVIHAAQKRHYSDIDKVPKNHVGLVLGTSRRLRSGGANPFFVHRMRAAAELFHAGKIDHILVSGDNRYTNYNEPRDMALALQDLRVPQEAITLDFAGFRTLDSVVRAHRVFGQKRFTIISQENHNYRALFIGRAHELDVVAYNAEAVSWPQSSKTRIREILARTKAVLDVYLLHAKPHFLGDPVFIPPPTEEISQSASREMPLAD